MANESGSYDDATMARKYAMAQALLKQPTTPITSWAQGLNQLAEGALGGYQISKLDAERKAEKTKESADLFTALGLPAPAAAPEAPTGFQKIASLLSGGGGMAPAAAPQPAPVPQGAPMGVPQPQPAPSPVIGPNDPSPLDTAPYPAGPMGAPGSPAMPRGLRNNNPLNIEAGSFTQGQPGFAGSDGRFAKFESPDQGTAAASKLLDTYQSKYGLNTPAGIIGRWAPQGENNSNAYAATIAKKLGIGPNDPIPPEMRPQLIAAMSEVENGKPAAVNAIASALQGGASGAPTTAAATPTPAPAAAAPAAGGGGILAGVPTAQRAQIAQLLTSNNPTAKAMGTALLQQSIKPNDFGFQTQPDGTILRTDPRKGTVEPVYQGATKPTFGVIGESEDGKKTYGFIDTAKGKVTPLEATKPGDDRPTITGPDGKEIVIPKGVDVKTFKTEVSKVNADAAVGKKTEVQGAAEQFGNRMENAEKNFTGVATEGLGMSGAAQTIAGKVPVVGQFGQSGNFQKMEQAKQEFITAILRKESGAAIGKEEYRQYDKQFFPQPGDKPEVIAQKTEARRVAIDAMKKTAGPSYKSPTATPAAAPVTKSIGGKEYYQENGQWYEK